MLDGWAAAKQSYGLFSLIAQKPAYNRRGRSPGPAAVEMTRGYSGIGGISPSEFTLNHFFQPVSVHTKTQPVLPGRMKSPGLKEVRPNLHSPGKAFACVTGPATTVSTSSDAAIRMYFIAMTQTPFASVDVLARAAQAAQCIYTGSHPPRRYCERAHLLHSKSDIS